MEGTGTDQGWIRDLTGTEKGSKGMDQGQTRSRTGIIQGGLLNGMQPGATDTTCEQARCKQDTNRMQLAQNGDYD